MGPRLAAAKCIELLPDGADTETSQRREWKASDVMPEAAVDDILEFPKSPPKWSLFWNQIFRTINFSQKYHIHYIERERVLDGLLDPQLN